MWWHSIDDVQRARQIFERATTKQTIYFLSVMGLLSGIAALVGIIQLSANQNILNQIPDLLILAVVGILGFAFIFPWFTITYFMRHQLSTLRELEQEIERLRTAVDKLSVRED